MLFCPWTQRRQAGSMTKTEDGPGGWQGRSLNWRSIGHSGRMAHRRKMRNRSCGLRAFIADTNHRVNGLRGTSYVSTTIRTKTIAHILIASVIFQRHDQRMHWCRLPRSLHRLSDWLARPRAHRRLLTVSQDCGLQQLLTRACSGRKLQTRKNSSFHGRFWRLVTIAIPTLSGRRCGVVKATLPPWRVAVSGNGARLGFRATT